MNEVKLELVQRSETVESAKDAKMEVGTGWRFGSLAASVDVGRERVGGDRFRIGRVKERPIR
ncbi:hypothetical protein GOBAR_DD00150 [Gossypium barbadense]|nr:hypothetical protein GOBAR_DD00150 [Gossypium barbadense]